MNKAVFLDRDGVITEDPPHYAHRLDQVRIIRQSAEAIHLLNNNGYKVIVVSNQSGVAKGYFAEKDIKIFNEEMIRKLNEEGAFVDAIYYCPHHPQAVITKYRLNCNCRKPNPGMLLSSIKKFDLNIAESFMVGDKKSDIEAGKAVGCSALLVLTGHGRQECKILNKLADGIYSNLFEAVLCRIIPHSSENKIN